jgi:hypothetical protein
MDAFTPRNAAKFVVTSIIKVKTAQKTEEIITDYTHFEEDDMVVDIAGGLVGWWLGDKLKPYTDKMVDKTADFVNGKYQEFKDRKNSDSEEK